MDALSQRMKPVTPALRRLSVTVVVLAVAGCTGTDEAPARELGPREAVAAEPDDSLPPRAEAELDADWERVKKIATWAWSQGVDTLPMGEAVARIGERFVGTPYRPQTLEIPGPERLVVNLQALDCVTFVETSLALARLVKSASPAVLEDRKAYKLAYRRILTGLRYRKGELSGYPSRLHYFSEWISDNEARGHLRDVTGELGGIRDPEPIGFMSAHPEAYRQLAGDPENLEAMREIEERLSREERRYLPQDRIPLAEREIRTGDIIAATSTVVGLDVAHTGIALRRDGGVYLMHAPLVGDSVQISRRTLAQRVGAVEGQDGIMVARPLPPEGG